MSRSRLAPTVDEAGSPVVLLCSVSCSVSFSNLGEFAATSKRGLCAGLSQIMVPPSAEVKEEGPMGLLASPAGGDTSGTGGHVILLFAVGFEAEE